MKCCLVRLSEWTESSYASFTVNLRVAANAAQLAREATFKKKVAMWLISAPCLLAGGF
jgi:hypothetical protein